MSHATNRRRRIVIDSELQKRIVFAGAWPPCLGMGLAVVLLGFLCSQLGREALEAGVELPSLPWLFMAMAGLLVVAMGFVVWASLRISHRVAGPAQNFRRVLAQVRDGDLSARVHLRDGDYLVGVADLVNNHLQWLEQHPPGTSDASGQPAEPAAEVQTAVSAASGATTSDEV